jgi:hypothetical protein
MSAVLVDAIKRIKKEELQRVSGEDSATSQAIIDWSQWSRR